MRDTGALDGDRRRDRRRQSVAGRALRSGKTQTFGWFVGQVMKKTGGRADPAAVREALTRALDGRRHDPALRRLEEVRAVPRRPARRVVPTSSAGEFVFLTGSLRRRQVDAPAAPLPRGAALLRADPRQRPQHRRPAAVAGAVPPPDDGRRLPGLQAHRPQDGLREHLVRPERAGPAAGRAEAARLPRPQAGGPPPPDERLSRRALGRRAAARGDRAGDRQRADAPPRRRADGQPRPGPGRGDHAALRRDSTSAAPPSSWRPTTSS